MDENKTNNIKSIPFCTKHQELGAKSTKKMKKWKNRDK